MSTTSPQSTQNARQFSQIPPFFVHVTSYPGILILWFFLGLVICSRGVGFIRLLVWTWSFCSIHSTTQHSPPPPSTGSTYASQASSTLQLVCFCLKILDRLLLVGFSSVWWDRWTSGVGWCHFTSPYSHHTNHSSPRPPPTHTPTSPPPTYSPLPSQSP